MLERGSPPGHATLVAEVDGAIVAWAPSGRHGDGSGWFWIGVAPAHRNRGVGRALYDRIEARLRDLGVPLIRTDINDEDGLVFLLHRGFAATNVMRLQALDLTTADLPEPTVETLPLRAVEIDSVRELFQQGHADIPSHSPRAPFTDDDFRLTVVESELLDHPSSAIASDGLRVVRGRRPGTSEDGSPGVNQVNPGGRVPKQNPSPGTVGEACNQPPLGVAVMTLPHRAHRGRVGLDPGDLLLGDRVPLFSSSTISSHTRRRAAGSR